METIYRVIISVIQLFWFWYLYTEGFEFGIFFNINATKYEISFPKFLLSAVEIKQV